jgi:hypothetical protein
MLVANMTRLLHPRDREPVPIVQGVSGIWDRSERWLKAVVGAKYIFVKYNLKLSLEKAPD